MSGRKAVHEEYLKAADEVLRLRAEVLRLRTIAEAAREFHNFKDPGTHRALNPTCRLCVALDSANCGYDDQN